MPNPMVAKILAYLAGLLGVASAAMMAAQITGDMPIGLAMYSAMGALAALLIWLAMWTVTKVNIAVQRAMAAVQAPQGVDTPTVTMRVGVRSVPVPVPVPMPRVSDVDTIDRRPSLSSLPAALLGQLVRLGVESSKKDADRS